MQNNQLNKFFAALNQFDERMKRNHHKENELKQKVEQIKMLLEHSSQFNESVIGNKNKLSDLINDFTNNLKIKFDEWDKRIITTLPMQHLSKTFEDKIIFLVFGKVNAGKSSFSNQVVEFYHSEFPEEQIRRFALKNDEIINIEGKFAEGFTETTAQIQGVELGKYFVLLDSPGLHSTQEENGNLTKQFIDSADAVLWLTPSSSPGQVQELKDLKYELEKGKPLLPVITRSDEVEEDWDEGIQDIVHIIKDKALETRNEQEDNVFSRLKEYEEAGNSLKDVKKPISISVHTYKLHQSLEKSGLSSLFNEMTNLVKEASDYKGNKADKQIKNFINENVISFLNNELKNQILSIFNESTNILKKLEKDRVLITEIVNSTVLSRLYQIVTKHKDSKNKDGILKEVNEIISNSLNKELSHRLSDFVGSLTRVSIELESKSISDFEDRKISYQQERGAGKKSIAQAGGGAAGTAVGAAIGSIIAPGLGTAIGGTLGGILGGLVGGAVGSIMIEVETITDIVGVDTEQMENSLKSQVSSSVTQVVDRTINNLITQIESLEKTCETLNIEIEKIIKQF